MQWEGFRNNHQENVDKSSEMAGKHVQYVTSVSSCNQYLMFTQYQYQKGQASSGENS